MLSQGIKQLDEDAYDQAVDDSSDVFQELVALFFAGAISLALFHSRFREALQLHYTRLMLLALDGEEPTDRQLDALNERLAIEYVILDRFVAALEDDLESEQRATWRAGLYAQSRDIFVYFSLPQAVAILMEGRVGLPGDICYGNGLCGCHLEVDIDAEGNALVYWIVNPEKEHCEACLAAQGSGPYFFSFEELANA